MDRTYVMQQHKVPVFQLGLDLWRDQVRAGRGNSGSAEALFLNGPGGAATASAAKENSKSELCSSWWFSSSDFW